MTDYRKWDNFDCDEAEAEIEEKEKIKEFQKCANKPAADVSRMDIEARKLAEIMEAKAAVAALKKISPIGSRKRNQIKHEGSTNVSNNGVAETVANNSHIKKDSEVHCNNVVNNICDMPQIPDDPVSAISFLSKSLADAVHLVNSLQGFLDKGDASTGYSSCKEALRFLSVLEILVYKVHQDKVGSCREYDAESEFLDVNIKAMTRAMLQSILTLFEMTLSTLSFCAFAQGQYAAAAETSRSFIKFRQLKQEKKTADQKYSGGNSTAGAKHFH